VKIARAAYKRFDSCSVWRSRVCARLTESFLKLRILSQRTICCQTEKYLLGVPQRTHRIDNRFSYFSLKNARVCTDASSLLHATPSTPNTLSGVLKGAIKGLRETLGVYQIKPRRFSSSARPTSLLEKQLRQPKLLRGIFHVGLN